MKILIACEESGKVRDAFRRLGHDAWSCDTMPTRPESEFPEFHYQQDVVPLLVEQWDMLIGFPPCTFLCNSGVSWLHKDPERWAKLDDGARLFKALLDAPINKICLENPVPHKYAVDRIGRKYDQTVQPWHFGHAESKRTCFWLKGLPALTPTSDLKAETKARPKKDAQRLHWASPSPDRAKLRSETFSGIAQAMASQWGET